MYFLVFCLLLSGSFADIPISHNVAEDVLTETEKFPIMTIGDILEEEIANVRISYNDDKRDLELPSITFCPPKINADIIIKLTIITKTENLYLEEVL